MDEALSATARYWCHACSRAIVPVMRLEIKCPDCGDGFVEEMESIGNDQGTEEELEPVTLGMTGNQRDGEEESLDEYLESLRRRRRSSAAILQGTEEELEPVTLGMTGNQRDGEEESLDEYVESLRRRRRSSTAILQLLQGISDRAGNSPGDRERERVIIINPHRQSVIVQDSSNQSSRMSNLTGLFGDYFIGTDLDFLSDHPSENDPNQFGTPPARQEDVEAMAPSKIDEKVQCTVCLDDLEVGTKALEMPCKHKFHEACILPWLERHSSCPVCRFQLPVEGENENDSDGTRDGNGSPSGSEEETDESPANESGRRFQLPWPLSSLFSWSG